MGPPQVTVPSGVCLLCHGAPPPPLTLLFLPLLLLTISFPPGLPHWCFLKYVIIEVPPAFLVGLAVSCGGSILEPAGTACVWDRAAPNLLPERPPLQTTPHYQNLAIYTQYISIAERKGCLYK